MSKAKENTKKGINILMIVSLFYFLMGAILLFAKGGLGYIIYIMSGTLIVLGMVWVIRYLINDGYMQPGNYNFSFGLLMIIFGIWLFLQHMAMSVMWIPRILGAAAVLTSVMKIQDALTLRRLKDERWVVFLILSVITLVMAGVILFSEERLFVNEAGTVSWYVPLVLFVDGVCNLVILFRVSGKIRSYKNETAVAEEKRTQEMKQTGQPSVMAQNAVADDHADKG